MPPTDPPIDVTDILAQPREFAQKLARVERERAELIETVARLRAECNDAQAVARAYILRAERAEADVERLTAAAERLLKMHTRQDGSIGSDTSIVEGALMDLRATLRQPGPARAQADQLDDESARLLSETIAALSKPAQAGGEATK